MDLDSTTTAVASLVLVIIKTSKRLLTLFDSYKDAHRTLFMIQTEFAIHAAALSQVQAQLLQWSGKSAEEMPATITDSLDEVFIASGLTMLGLTTELDKIFRDIALSDSLRIEETPRYLWREEKMTTLIDRLRGQSVALGLLSKAIGSVATAKMLAIFESGRPILDDVVKADVASLRQLYGDKAFSASFLALRVREAGTFYDILVEESLDGLTTGLHTPEGSEAAFELDTFSVVSPSELLTDAETSASQPTGAHFQSLVVQTLPSRSIATQQSTNQNISALRAARGHPLQMPVNPRPWLMTEQKLAEGIDAILITSQIPAIGVVALTPRGECSLLRGVRKFNDPTPANEDDKFLMARLTSVMTSILLARMVDEGLLNWETTLLEALPEWEGIIHPGNHLTTMAWLVGGMCGWEVNLREAEDGLLWEHIKTPGIGAREARVAVLQSYLGRPPTKSPGQGPSVWNEAYIMCIAAILETMLDCSWEELMQTKLFDPLGMTLSGFGPPERLIESATGSGTPTQPWPHNHQVQNASDSPVPSIPQRNSNEGGFYLTTAFRPIYGVYSTLRDMTNFGRFCQRESIATTDALAPNSSASSQPIPSGSLRLSDRSREIIFGIQNPSYENIMKVSSSLGWTKGDYLLQGVSMDGWCSRMIVAPRAGTVLIAFTNVGKKTPYDALNATFKLACRF